MLHRAWGTRFDTLLSPSSPASPSLPSLPSSPRHIVHSPSSASLPDRYPHDACVFVGSLPPTAHTNDLIHLLREHLAEHAQVKDVKVVRDQKGGLCAFVQCEDAAAAATLIDNLTHTDPKPFMGRILRYEPARAFRSLLLSYRTPFQSRTRPDVISDDRRQVESISVELDLPFAMRLHKHPKSRVYSITYNEEAIEAEKRFTPESEGVRKLFFHPVAFDEKTLYQIVAFFGHLETFCPLKTEGATGHDDSSSHYPPPHDSVRSPNMDMSCWEVKWAHRDDCLAALNALRYVPHITATWAHQAHFHSVYHGRPASHVHHHSNRPQTFLPKREYYSPREGRTRDDFGSASSRVDWSESDFPPLATAYHRKPRPRDSDERFACSFQSEQKTQSPPSSSELRMSPRLATSIMIDRESSTAGIDSSKSHTRVHKDMDRFRCPEVDPTSLFVGGLEMYWDENRLRQIFSKYEGLLNVDLHKPENSPVAFAFIKFDNTESPARAVANEHNKVYDDRPMRVQMRYSSIRHSWKYARGRSEARFHCDSDTSKKPPSSDVDSARPDDDEPLSIKEEIRTELSRKDSPNADTTSAHDVSGNEGSNSVVNKLPGNSPDEKNDLQSSKPEAVVDQSLGPSQESPESPESDEAISARSPSPPDSVELLIEPTQATPPPYTYGGTDGANYYMPPWAQPYPHHIPFYGGYPPYASPAQYPEVTSGPPSIPPWVQGAPYTAFIPYSSAQSTEQPHSQHSGHSEPPVVPTGFIQNEQGTLIAVYQTDAIDRYLATNRNSAPTTQQVGMTPVPAWNHQPQAISTSLPPSSASQGPISVGGRPVVPGSSVPWAHIPSHLYYPAPPIPFFPPPPHSQPHPSVYPAAYHGKVQRGVRSDGGIPHGGNRPPGHIRQPRVNPRPNIQQRGSFGGPRPSYRRPVSSPGHWNGAM